MEGQPEANCPPTVLSVLGCAGNNAIAPVLREARLVLATEAEMQSAVLATLLQCGALCAGRVGGRARAVGVGAGVGAGGRCGDGARQ